ncbi:MAG: TIGR01777 family oxidoreductase [Proteobacteria bacterium]|nr:TIGR01777 family oxidoreductase [Pseudomonadota bacterium]
MRVVVTGATGFIGRALTLRLARDGHHVTAWVRDPDRARRVLGPDCDVIRTDDPDALKRAVAAADAVVNLAGEPIVGGILRGRWTRRRKATLIESRLGPTRAVVAAIRAAAATGRAPTLISASAVGWYGTRGDELLPETAAHGQGFAAELCRSWEEVALNARAVTRVVVVRIGVVLGREGGALAKLVPLTKWMLGGPIAGGVQWMPWIHVDDLVDGLVHAMVTPTLAGPVNLVAPAPVRQRAFAQAIGRAVGRPAIAPAPGFALRLLLGEAATVLTASQRAVSEALLASGFVFRYPELDAALQDLTASTGIAMRRLRADEAPTSSYVLARKPRYVLVARSEIAAPLARVFAFFASAENLQLLTPPGMAFVIETPTPIAMAKDAVIDYRLRILGVPARWRTVIEQWTTPSDARDDVDAMFVDAQHRGPYRAWWHEHRFHQDGDRTVMEDRIYYAPPLGVLGAIANKLVVAGQLRRIFGYRAAMIRQRFGTT